MAAEEEEGGDCLTVQGSREIKKNTKTEILRNSFHGVKYSQFCSKELFSPQIYFP